MFALSTAPPGVPSPAMGTEHRTMDLRGIRVAWRVVAPNNAQSGGRQECLLIFG